MPICLWRANQKNRLVSAQVLRVVKDITVCSLQQQLLGIAFVVARKQKHDLPVEQREIAVQLKLQRFHGLLNTLRVTRHNQADGPKSYSFNCAQHVKISYPGHPNPLRLMHAENHMTQATVWTKT